MIGLLHIVAIDATVCLIPRRVTLNDITIPLADTYSEVLTELVKVIINKEQTSFDQARMRYEDVDKIITDIVQNLALTEMNDELVVVSGALD